MNEEDDDRNLIWTTAIEQRLRADLTPSQQSITCYQLYIQPTPISTKKKLTKRSVLSLNSL